MVLGKFLLVFWEDSAPVASGPVVDVLYPMFSGNMLFVRLVELGSEFSLLQAKLSKLLLKDRGKLRFF